MFTLLRFLNSKALPGLMPAALLWIAGSMGEVYAQVQAPAAVAPAGSIDLDEGQAPVARPMPPAPRIARGGPVRTTQVLVSCPHCGVSYYVVVAIPIPASYPAAAPYPPPPPPYPAAPAQAPARSASVPGFGGDEIPPAPVQSLPAPPETPPVPAAVPGF